MMGFPFSVGPLLNASVRSHDPDEPEGNTRSEYMSRKEFVVILGIIAVILVSLYPVYRILRENSYQASCRNNAGAISRAIQLYSEENDGRLPVIYARDGGGGLYIEPNSGLPVTWVTVIHGYLTARASFRCQATRNDEVALCEHPEGRGQVLETNFGMYTAMDRLPLSRLSAPGDTVLFAETVNFGARGTLNPQPFLTGGGMPIEQDAFIIGYNDSNELFTDESSFVTRLAFFNSAPDSSGEVRSRHRDGVIAVFADGSLGFLQPEDIQLQRTELGLGGLWRAEPEAIR